MENHTVNPRRRPRKKSFWEQLFRKRKTHPAAEKPQTPHRRAAKRSPIYTILIPLFFVLSFAFMELVFHITEFKNGAAWYPILFAIPTGMAAGFLCDLFKEKIARIVRYVITVAAAVWYCVQIVYFHVFQSFLSLSLLGMGDDVFTNFLASILLAIWESLIPILLMFVPVAGLFFLHKFYRPNNRFALKRSIFALAFVLFANLGVWLLLPLGGTGDHSAYANFHNNWVLDLSMEKLGVMTTTGIDLKYWALGDSIDTGNTDLDVPIDVQIPVAGDDTTPPSQDVEQVVKYNIIEGLDFAAMAETEEKKTPKKVLQYLSTLEPTKQNQYTGMFEGYNLIMITAESFSPMGIHPELTPTLYKLANSGFDFTNFWTMYPSNTTNGEYSNMTGLVPDISKPKSDGSFVYSIKNTMNMSIASWFNAHGATSRAYHNHTSGYYKRIKTHPNLGYAFLKGKAEIGGLKGWPESDHEMAQKTVGEYINDDYFHTYYMTVSGHHNYRFGYNTRADRHEDEVKHLDMSEGPRAYIATHIELDRMLQHLIEQLDAAGKLEKTVICIMPDHYPYGLTDAQYKEMLGHRIGYDGMERYRNDLIIWNSAMETIQIDKPACQVDVLPTLLNLFGFTYDSRLYSGMDILSDSYGLAMLSNQSFITDKIVYNSRYEKVYKLDPDWEMPEGYLEAYIQIVKNRFSIASNILNSDFYAKLPADIVEAAQKE